MNPRFALLLGRLAIVGAAPFFMAWAWLACEYYGCALSGPLTDPTLHRAGLAARLPWPTGAAIAAVAGWCALQALLAQTVPGPMRLGTVTPAGRRLIYRVNGLAAWVVTATLVGVVVMAGGVPATFVPDQWAGLLGAANLAGFLAAGGVWIKAHCWPTWADERLFRGSAVADFTHGIELNPRLGPFDLKLLLIGRVGMIGWTAVVCSFAAAQLAARGTIAAPMMVLIALQLLYALDFFARESWYLTTLDIVDARLGFVLAWGSLVWLPFFYSLPAVYQARQPVALGPEALVAISALGVLGYGLFLSANGQRHRARRLGSRCRIFGRPPRLIDAEYVTADGARHTSVLLASGWWGIVRHPNYVGDLMIATAIGLTCGVRHLLPWSYTIFLAGLLVRRLRHDERRCQAKYGSAWDAYRALVPYRLIPGIW